MNTVVLLDMICGLPAAGRLGRMSLLFTNGKKPPQKALRKIVGYLQRKACPVYMGYISLEVGWSLAGTQEMLDHLEHLQMVRQLTSEELKLGKFPEAASMYVLIGDPSLYAAED